MARLVKAEVKCGYSGNYWVKPPKLPCNVRRFFSTVPYFVHYFVTVTRAGPRLCSGVIPLKHAIISERRIDRAPPLLISIRAKCTGSSLHKL